MRLLKTLILFICGVLILTGCSGGVSEPVGVPGIPEVKGVESPISEDGSQRSLWGVWDIVLDPVSESVIIEPVRYAKVHFNITEMITPPICDDCLTIFVNYFDPVEHIYDVDVTLRNPTLITARDVRGIVYFDDYLNRLLNPDAWTYMWEIPGGANANPFKTYAKSELNRMFKPGAEHMENFVIHMPWFPQYPMHIQYAVDASWPGNCKEPYEISNYTQSVLHAEMGSVCTMAIDVFDWQDDVNEVRFYNDGFIDGFYFTKASGNTWELEFTNTYGFPKGEYWSTISATSENSGDERIFCEVYLVISD